MATLRDLVEKNKDRRNEHDLKVGNLKAFAKHHTIDNSKYNIDEKPHLAIRRNETVKSKFLYTLETLEGYEIGPNDGPDIFARATVDEKVPYVAYYSNAYNLRRIYTGSDLPVIKQPERESLTIVVAKDTRFEHVEYNFTDGTLQITDISIIPEIERSLHLKLHPLNQEKLEANIGFFYNTREGFFVDINVLSHILINESFRSDFYIEEIDKPVYLKSYIDIHYLPFNVIDQIKRPAGQLGRGSIPKIHFKNMQVVASESLELGVPSNTNYVGIRIMYIRTQNEINIILDKLYGLFNYYIQQRNFYFDLFNQYLPDFKNIQLVEDRIKVRNKKTNTGYGAGILGKQYPNTFTKNYNIGCPVYRQPIALTPEESEAAQREGKNVLGFPKQKPVVYLSCEVPQPPEHKGITYPYMSMVNVKASVLPCCAARKNDTVKTYLERDLKPRIDSRSTTLIGGGKLLGEGGRGKIAKEVSTLLSSSQEEETWWFRYGVSGSPNSIIHAILVAIGDPQYAKLLDSTELETYVQNVRLSLNTRTYPGLYRQEMYDYSPKAIKDYISKVEDFLDPLLVIRGLEELFGVNIYIFGEANEIGRMEIPRHKSFYCVSQRIQRPTICIYRTFGSSVNYLNYPRCELIVRSTKDFNPNQRVDLHDGRVTAVCDKAIKELSANITWSPTDEKTPKITAFANLYAQQSLTDILLNSGTHQYIDDYGKLRGYVIEVKGVENSRMILLIPPGQPVNLPSITPHEFPKIKYSVLKSLDGPFAKISGVARNKDGLVNAVWYKLYSNMTYGICVPVIPERLPELSQLSGPDPPCILEESQQIIIGRIDSLKKILDVLLQIIKYLYYLQPSDQFFATHFVVDKEFKGDSSKYYDLGRIPRILSTQSETIDDVLVKLRKVAPTLIDNNGKIRLYSQNFADKIEFYIKTLIKIPIMTRPSDFILKDFYQSAADFVQQPGTTVITSNESYRIWQERKNGQVEGIASLPIKNVITNDDINLLEPYLFANKSGRVYLMQNVSIEDGVSRAIEAGYRWNNEKINYGSNVAPSQKIWPHLIYAPNDDMESDEKIILIADQRGQAVIEGSFVRILQYLSPIKRYAAMLPL